MEALIVNSIPCMASTSGSPFDNVAQVSKTYTPTRLSTPQQNPQLNAQKYQSSSNRQQQVQPKSQTRPQAQAQYNRVSTNNRQPASAYRAPAIANSYAYPKVQQQTRLPGPALVTKHFYIHAAPDEPEEPTRQRYVQLGQARKNFKSYYRFCSNSNFDSFPLSRISPLMILIFFFFHSYWGSHLYQSTDIQFKIANYSSTSTKRREDNRLCAK